ncbi:MAG: acetate/propionate family kinase [Ilumatobacteraceae bacterium]|nr:acetate/propionate family kinase [Ilumatobacteraceae bacterium]
MLVLVVNAGSSSLKLRLLDEADGAVRRADLPALSTAGGADALAATLAGWPRPAAIGHRIVHGGMQFTGPVRIDPVVRQQIDDLTDLAPLHQPKSLEALDAVTGFYPTTPAVASFDTAFHATIPAEAATYAIPRAWREQHAIRRYGFHGLSHQYGSTRAAVMLGRSLEDLRIVTCHLGGGASAAAIVAGRSVDTTMGFTPLEGLVMATRSGSVDPGLVLWLQEHVGLGAHEISVALEEQSGMLALAGDADMRAVETRVTAGDAEATLAMDVFVHRLVGSIASMAASAGGIDALVFTGGVGEHSSMVRGRAASRLAFLGLTVDAAANEDATGDTDVSGDDERGVRTLVVAAREDIQIASEVRRIIPASGGEAPG